MQGVLMRKLRRNARSILTQALVLVMVLSIVQVLEYGAPIASAGTPVSGSIDVNTTWLRSMSPVWVDGNLTVSENVSLQVEAGVEVLFDGPYHLSVKGRLVLNGTAAETVNLSSNRSTPSMGDWKGIQIEFLGNLEADFANVSYAGIGILLDSSHDSVRNCTFYQNSQGMSLHPSAESAQLRDNFFLRNQYGINSFSSSNNSIVRNTFVENEQGDISIIFDSQDNVIRLNDIRSGGGTGISLSGGKGNAILSNRIENSSGYGIYVSDSSDGTIADNRMDSSRIFGLAMFGSKNFTVRNNTFQTDSFEIKGDYFEHYNHTIDTTNTVDGSPLRYYLSIQNLTIANVQAGDLTIAWSSNITVVDSTVQNGDGISIHYTNDSKLSNISTANGIQGLKLYRSLRNTISNSSMLSTYAGLELVESHFNTIDGNVLEGNNYSGVWIRESDHNTISRNEVAFTGKRGIAISASSNNTIKENLIRETEAKGLSIGGSPGNTIYHNAFIRNGISASSNWGPNALDNDYPSGGNFWDDYNGNDTMSGPDQNLTGSDGIGDEPYVVRMDNIDRYPLMAPPFPLSSEPPGNVSARLSGGDRENVTLEWSPSEDERSGLRNVVGYRIYAGTHFDSAGVGYGFLGQTINGTYEYAHEGSGFGDPGNYFYRVCAVSNYNESFCASQQASKLTIPVTQTRIALVSIPLVLGNHSIRHILQDLPWLEADTYDPSPGSWKRAWSFKAYSGDFFVDSTRAFWVQVSRQCNITVAGMIPQNVTLNLSTGWNLVGLPSFVQNYTVGDLVSTDDISRIEGLNISMSPFYLERLSDSHAIELTGGYWVKATSQTAILIDNR